MSRFRSISLCLLLALCGLTVAIVGRAADAAMVRVGPLVLKADGGFTPRHLPQNKRVPIRFEGYADIESRNSAPPPAVRQMRLDFDRDGLIETRGLASCLPSQIEGTTPQVARQVCKAAIIGRGNVGAVITLPGSQSVDVKSPLTLFNGPRLEGNLTVVAHAQANFPAPETFVVVVPIERRQGAFSYRATVDVPAIAQGYGAITHVDAKLGRLYRYRGSERSYTLARCSDGILETRGLLWFADGTVISGSLFKPCSAVN